MAMTSPASVRRVRGTCLTAVCLGVALSAGAQDGPVVFLHGFGSSPETWDGAAARLQSSLALQPIVPRLSSRAPYEVQAGEAQAALGNLPAQTVAVGHSNGGIVAREWSQAHALSGIVTLGTPHQGAPLVSNLGGYLGFNFQLLSSMSAVYDAFAAGCCDWYWLLNHFHPYWSFTHYFADVSVREVAVSAGITVGAPVASQMVPGSGFLSNLNAPGNLAREAAAVPARIGIVSVAHNFYWGGPLRAAFPDYGDTLALYRDIALWGMVVSANHLYGFAPPDDFWARETANRLMHASHYLSAMDEWWCQAVSTPGFGQCWQNDTLVPVWSQVYPGGLSLMASLDGPAHTQETRMSDGILHAVLSHYLAIPPRQTPPAPQPSNGAVAYEHVGFAGESFSVGSGSAFVGWEWNDRLSSVHVPPGRTLVLYEHADYQGESLTLTGDAVDLRDYAGPSIDGTWNDVASSIEVR